MHPSSLEISFLGPLEVKRRGRALALPRSRKARALLAYLAASGRAHGREHLCDLLWQGPADPRAALRGALSALRPLLDDSRITRLVTRGDRVEFDSTGVLIDLAAARRIAANSAELDIEALKDAVDGYRGVFLEGLEIPRCYRFEAWCTAERETARRLQVTILAALIHRLRDQPAEALHYARQRLLLQPCAEDAHLAVMKLLGEMGQMSEALEQYEACRRILKNELGVRPSREIEALRRAVTPVRTLTPPAPQRVRTTSSPRDSALVGRRIERQTLERVIGVASSREHHVPVLLVGEAGIGKTRLLDELATMTREAGGEVLTGRAFEAEMIRPYGAWIDALRAIPTGEIPAALRSQLAPLLPELGGAPADSADRGALFDAVSRLLASRIESRCPLVLLLDDLQWMDESSVALLHFTSRSALPGMLTVCAARRAELEDNPATLGLVRALGREGNLLQLDLAPLDADDTVRLVHQVDPDVDAERVFMRSSGNPLFALEIVRVGKDENLSLSPTLEGLIDGRLAKLDHAARALVPWAAALGRDFSPETLGRLVDQSAAEILAAAEELERRGVVRPSGAGYDFAHDLFREAAYKRISEPRRRLLHGRIADVLSGGADLDTEHAGDVARHAELAGNHVLAARAYLAAAKRALWAFAPEEAAELAARGIRHLDDLPPETRLELRLELLGFSIYPGMKGYRVPNLEGELSRVIAEAMASGLQAQVYRGFQLIAHLHFLNGDFTGALDRSLRAQRAGRAADPATVVRAIGDTARCLGIIERDMPRAGRLAREANALAGAIGYEGHELPQALAHVYHHAGDLDDSVECFERAAYLARRERGRWSECVCLSRLAMIELERKRPAEALVRCRDLLAVTRKLGEGSDAPFAEALEALALLGLDENDAVERLDQAVTGLRDADSRWMIAYIQNLAGRMDIDASNSDSARSRIGEALEAAELVDRRNEIVVARSLLARLAIETNNRAAARSYLSEHCEDLDRTGAFSARARRALDAAESALAQTSTLA